MVKKISAVEARKNFGQLLNRVSLLHEEILIERAGKTMAKLVHPDTKTLNVSSEGKLDFRRAAGLGAEIWKSIDVDEYIRKERINWE